MQENTISMGGVTYLIGRKFIENKPLHDIVVEKLTTMQSEEKIDTETETMV